MLNKQTLSLPFTQGVDSKTDQILAGKPSRVENAVFVGGSLQKRYGTQQLSITTDTGGDQSSGEAIFPFDSELVRLNSGKAYGLGPDLNKWITKAGNATICKHSLQRICRKPTSQSEFDHIYANGVTVVAWIDSGLHVAVYDETSGTFYQTGATALTGTSAHRFPRLVALGNTVLIFSGVPGTNSLYVTSVATATPATAPAAPTLIEADLGATSTGATFDAVAFGTSYAVVGYTDSSTHLQLIAVNISGTVLGSPAKTDLGACSNAGGGANTYVNLRIDGNGVGYLTNFKSSLYWLTFSPTAFTTTHALTQIDGDASHFLATTAEATTGQVTVFSSGKGASNSGTVNIPIGKAVVTSTAISSAYAAIAGTNGMVLQTEGFTFNQGAHVGIVNDILFGVAGIIQPTTWVLKADGTVLAKILPSLSAVQGIARLSRPFISPAGATALLIAEQGNLTYTSVAGNAKNVTAHGITRANFTLARGSDVPALRVGDSVYIGGSLPKVYDGQQVVEAGHNLFPEEPVASIGAGANLATNSTYSYRVLYSWTNAKGELQRSAPSPASTVTTAGATQQGSVIIPTQRLSGRDAVGISNVQIEVYRTEGNGANFYRVSTVAAPLLNDTSASTVTFTDATVTDDDLIHNELLYTTGGVYDNIAPPAYTIATVHKTRLIIAGLDDPYAWRSSSVAIANQMLRFNEAWGGRVPPTTGPITALASLDGNLIVFTTLGAYIVPGDGPDLLGNNNWTSPQQITSVDAGAVSWQSVATTPQGIVFQTKRGIHLLNRGLGMEYFGADVEQALPSAPIIRAVLLRPEVEQLWFLADIGPDTETNDAVCLVWDYHYLQWSVLKPYGGRGLCYYQSKLCRVRSDGTIFQEQPGTYLDTGVPYSSTIETNWVKTAGIQGFQRIWRCLLVGQGNDAFTLTVQVKYDYAASYTETASTFTVSPGGAPWQIRHHMVQQKCESFKLLIQDSPTGASGRGMSLSDLTIEYGTKKGAKKLPAAVSG